MRFRGQSASVLARLLHLANEAIASLQQGTPFWLAIPTILVLNCVISLTKPDCRMLSTFFDSPKNIAAIDFVGDDKHVLLVHSFGSCSHSTVKLLRQTQDFAV